MKKTHIIGLIFIAVAIGVIISSIAGSSTYSNFSEAFANPGKKYTIIGWLDHKQTIQEEPMRCSFYMKDKENTIKKVVYNQPKPTDFERSEEIVLTGSVDGDVFIATEMKLKCPSKYNELQKQNQ